MIDISCVQVSGWEAALRGMRNPMNSWENSDSRFYDGGPVIGARDLQLMKNLALSGTDHAKFLRFLTVTADINAPMYWWKECDTYKVGTVRLSTSTMHRIHSREICINDFSYDHLSSDNIVALEGLIAELNRAREAFLKTNDKHYWWQMIQMLPSSYNQLSTVQFSYQVLRNMYKARRHHRLDEWRAFCVWIEGLPYSEIITAGAEREESV